MSPIPHIYLMRKHKSICLFYLCDKRCMSYVLGKDDSYRLAWDNKKKYLPPPPESYLHSPETKKYEVRTITYLLTPQGSFHEKCVPFVYLPFRQLLKINNNRKGSTSWGKEQKLRDSPRKSYQKYMESNIICTKFNYTSLALPTKKFNEQNLNALDIIIW